MAGLHGGIVRTPVHRELIELHKVLRAARSMFEVKDWGVSEEFWSKFHALRRAVLDADSSPDFDRADNEVPVGNPREE